MTLAYDIYVYGCIHTYYGCDGCDGCGCTVVASSPPDPLVTRLLTDVRNLEIGSISLLPSLGSDFKVTGGSSAELFF